MLKWLLIFLGVCALVVAVVLMTCKNQNPGQKEERSPAELSGPAAIPQPQNNDGKKQGCDCSPKSPCWHILLVWPEGITAWAIILTFAVIGWQADETRKAALATEHQVELSKETLIQTQRPKIAVRTFYFGEPQSNMGQVPNRILFQSMLSGQFYIVNLGGTKAIVKEIHYEFYISPTLNLPAKRPWEGKNGVKCQVVFEAGQSRPHVFGRTDPISADEAYSLSIKRTYLFLMGWIDYVDSLGIRRTTRFCRLYDAASERFSAIEDAEYESAD